MRNRILAAIIFLLFRIAIASLLRVEAVKGPTVTTSVQPLADGHVHLAVLNTSGIPISALAAVGTRTLRSDGTTVKSVRFFDTLLSPLASKELTPGQTYTFTFFGPNPPPSQITRGVELKAAIFANGSTWGDAQWVNTLLLRRSAALNYNNKALKTIEGAAAGGATREQLAQQLTRTQADEIKAATSTAEKQMADFAFSEALLTLGETTTENGTLVPLAESAGRARSKLLGRINRLQMAKPPIVN